MNLFYNSLSTEKLILNTGVLTSNDDYLFLNGKLIKGYGDVVTGLLISGENVIGQNVTFQILNVESTSSVFGTKYSGKYFYGGDFTGNSFTGKNFEGETFKAWQHFSGKNSYGDFFSGNKIFGNNITGENISGKLITGNTLISNNYSKNILTGYSFSGDVFLIDIIYCDHVISLPDLGGVSYTNLNANAELWSISVNGNAIAGTIEINNIPSDTNWNSSDEDDPIFIYSFGAKSYYKNSWTSIVLSPANKNAVLCHHKIYGTANKDDFRICSASPLNNFGGGSVKWNYLIIG